MITQIVIKRQHNWFKQIECSTTSPFPFIYFGEYYIIYSNINPEIIKQPDEEVVV